MKVFVGRVLRVGDKTAKVAVTRVVSHPVYGKRVKKTKNYLVHDELGVAVGATVRFAASRAFSKSKKWKLLEEIK